MQDLNIQVVNGQATDNVVSTQQKLNKMQQMLLSLNQNAMG